MKHFRIFILFIAAALVGSCIKTNNQDSGVGDAVIVAKKIGSNTEYGIALYAYTLSSFKSVTAVSELHPEKIYTLKSNQGFTTNFFYQTPDNEFTTTVPEASTYTFTFTFANGVSNSFQNLLSNKGLAPPNIEKCEYVASLSSIEVTWTLLIDADSYAINIWDGPTLVFASSELIKTKNYYSILGSGNGWANGFTPQNGKTYTVRLLAFLYEPNGGSYNMQATSMTETPVVWGTN